MSSRAAFGSWPSPITAELIVAGAATPGDVRAESGVVWWSQSRPDQGGRQQVLRRDPDGTVSDALPEWFNARTRVHEYGGAPWWVHDGVVFATSWVDQRVYRTEAGGEPVALTPEPAVPHGFRYADGGITPDGATVICVRESHDASQVLNEIVAFSAHAPILGGAVAHPAVIVIGSDFVSSPRISQDGRRVAWLTWNHPRMPWDGTELWVGDLHGVGSGSWLEGARRVAGGVTESLVQPEWGPDGSLYVVSDRSDWWNVYRVAGTDELVAVHPVAAEVGMPAWVFGQSRYVISDDAIVWMTFSDDVGAHLIGVGADGSIREIAVDAVALMQLRADGRRIVALVTERSAERWVASFGVGESDPLTVVRAGRDLGLDPAGLSMPRHITFPSANSRTAHGWFYPPAGVRDGEALQGVDGELPPLVTKIHGGPTAGADPSFSLGVQFWTSRGFAVVDVDYGGSTGYGRAYRRLLDGAWGVVDVEDACAAAQWLAGQGLVDGSRMAITGGSAGGFTVLAALATREVFAAGASHYGVADLGALARDTHKFEARYLDGLVGRWPQDEDVYVERSPLSHMDGFDRPLIVLQGLEDEVVPPAQAEMIVDALRAKGIPHAYLRFEGEQHGFRIAANIVRALTAELYFYSRVFGFTLPDEVIPVEIAFAERL